MVARVKWIDRKFTFDFPAGLYPEIIERLRGTPARVEDRIRQVPDELLRLKHGKSWSIQEHVGHLVSVESLLTNRLDDYESGKKDLTPADMSNRKTEDAHYNQQTLASILTSLRQVRDASVIRLEDYEPDAFTRTALHPRLNVPMRLVDAMYFFAEHDDYHLARITDLLRRDR
jgi:uncharacterized damage-inducible protein DinB